MPDNPFAALGLPVSRDVTDDDVRAAWRRVAAGTHPDLPDGGDPARFAAAAAAYAELRTAYGRGEAYANLREPRRRARERRCWRLAHRISGGRPAMLAARVAITAGLSFACVVAAGWQPATVAIAAGLLTWLLRTARYDLASTDAGYGRDVTAWRRDARDL